MQEASVSHNCGQSPAPQTIVSSVAAQEHLSFLVNRLSAATIAHWWKLIGDDPTSTSAWHGLTFSQPSRSATLCMCQMAVLAQRNLKIW